MEVEECEPQSNVGIITQQLERDILRLEKQRLLRDNVEWSLPLVIDIALKMGSDMRDMFILNLFNDILLNHFIVLEVAI